MKSKQDKLRESYLHISQPNCWETKINKEKILKTGKKKKKRGDPTHTNNSRKIKRQFLIRNHIDQKAVGMTFKVLKERIATKNSIPSKTMLQN